MTLVVRDLAAGYGRLRVLRGVSIEAGNGRVVALLGANGAGKTTLLRALSGLAEIQEGSITLDGVHTTRFSTEQLVAAGLIHVPQGRHLFGGMSVRENLEMGAYLLADHGETVARMERVYELFPVLKARAKRPASVLSGGEQQMLAIGRALMSAPSYLLLDELSLGLAPKTFSLILDVVRAINAGGTSILIAEQNAAKVLKLAHYAYVLENGRIAAEGAGESLLTDNRIRASYLGAA